MKNQQNEFLKITNFLQNDEIDLEEAEERLYAQVYHDNNSIELSTTAVENPVINLNKSNMRYWQDSNKVSEIRTFEVLEVTWWWVTSSLECLN